MAASFLKALGASAFMAGGVHALMLSTGGSLFWRVPLAVGAGATAYVILSRLLRAEELDALWKSRAGR
jgi:hypothetical protein